MTSDNNYPAPDRERYPGFRGEEIAAARLAAQAAALAAQERDAEPLQPEQANPDPLAAALEDYSRIRENGCPPEYAQVELILYSYFDTAGQVLAQQMGGDYACQPHRYIALAMMEYLNSRMTPESEFPAAETLSPSEKAAAGQASAEQGAE